MFYHQIEQILKKGQNWSQTPKKHCFFKKYDKILWKKLSTFITFNITCMFPLHMTPYGIVTGEGSRTIGTRNTDTLMPLSDVSSEIGFITIGSLTKRTFEFSAWNLKNQHNLTLLEVHRPKVVQVHTGTRDRFTVFRVFPHRNGHSHIFTGLAGEPLGCYDPSVLGPGKCR